MGLMLPDRRMFMLPKVHRVFDVPRYMASGAMVENFGEEMRIVFYLLEKAGAAAGVEILDVHMPRSGFDLSLINVAWDHLPALDGALDPSLKAILRNLH